MSENIAKQLEKLKEKMAYKKDRSSRKADAMNAFRERSIAMQSGDEVETILEKQKEEEAVAGKSNRRSAKKTGKGKADSKSDPEISKIAGSRDYRDAFTDG